MYSTRIYTWVRVGNQHKLDSLFKTCLVGKQKTTIQTKNVFALFDLQGSESV